MREVDVFVLTCGSSTVRQFHTVCEAAARGGTDDSVGSRSPQVACTAHMSEAVLLRWELFSGSAVEEARVYIRQVLQGPNMNGESQTRSERAAAVRRSCCGRRSLSGKGGKPLGQYGHHRLRFVSLEVMCR